MQGTILRALGAVGAIFLTLLAGNVLADTWPNPTTTQYYSVDRDMRFTVVPRGLSSPLAYFEDLVDGRENAGQADNGESIARGVLEERTATNSWEQVWAGPLVNDVAPVTAMVASDGGYVVTFDNWHSLGRGQHVIVIYDRQGRMIRSLALGDVIPTAWVRALSHSVSSTAWAGEHRFSERHLILQIIIPSDDDAPGVAAFVDISVHLQTGAVSPVDQNGWASALGQVEEANRALDVAEAERDRRFREPLQLPAEPSERAMHDFLIEAFYRVAPDWREGYPATKVLRDPQASNYAPSEGWLRDAFRDPYSGSSIMVAGLAETALVELLVRLGPDLQPTSLEDVTVYLAVSSEAWPTVQSALADTGATLVHLDTALAIPQRQERLDRFNEEADGMVPPALR